MQIPQSKPIAIPQQRVAGNMFGREQAIRSLKCIAIIGCEREITEEEYNQWDTPTKAEYGQSGWCDKCQNRVFVDPDDCICESVDVGIGIMLSMDIMCPTHGDPDIYDGPVFNYDPDMREDEPPLDLHEIEWVRM